MPETPDLSPGGISPLALQALARFVEDGAAPKRVHHAPDLPPGVVGSSGYALDSGSMGQMYGWLNQQPGWCGLGFPGYTYLSELAQRSEYIAPTETMANELTRRWITFEGGDEAKRKELSDAFEKFKIRAMCRQAVIHDGWFGRGQLFVKLKGQLDAAAQKPLIVDEDNAGVTVPKDSLIGFTPVEPIWSTPVSYNSNDPAADDFYKPDVWYVMGKPIHATRLLTFISRPLPDVLKPSYNFSGLSLSQLIEPYVARWLKGVDSVSRIINQFSLIYLATNMQSTLSGGDGSDIFKRLAMFNKLRDNRGIAAIDKGSEEFGQVLVPLSGLEELVAQLQEHMAAPTHIPLVKLTGVTPSGLNASSEEDLKVFYDWCGGEQQNILDPNVRTISQIVQCHLWGKPDPEIRHAWVPLDTPTDKEEAEIRKADAERDNTLVTLGAVSPDEVREKLAKDPDSGYYGLEGDAPGPMDMQLAEHGAELDEDGKDADHKRAQKDGTIEHKRAESTASKDHTRAKELERIKAKKSGAK